MTAWTIREARPDDVAAIHARIVDLAVYEREPEAVTGTAADLHDALFREAPAVFCHVAELDGEVVGIALWYLTYSTWEGHHGIHLEDLYVMPEHRGTRIGLGLLRTLAGICAACGYRRLEWSVLTWNQPSIDFYEAIGARPQEEWMTYRLDGEALTGFAA
ncbi:GNAT family N-acetyltransferase [Brachybacterium huguangmaarense]|uniref:GNAT family N-acetyltransferase n=1 Tax=Brachybacterium huguangmaarense TaxID=1652028 RepID=A0ABY6FXD9_9MICO|nr:GNAT family N-acetyltransferase [Brachybacterium huguangmaarense]UYG15580.1 GNAT family N-acetyltransferase [Brachybacterium huguangmaarense]